MHVRELHTLIFAETAALVVNSACRCHPTREILIVLAPLSNGSQMTRSTFANGTRFMF
jgi:hypothetical protein